MTRLLSTDICDISTSLKEYDNELIRLTGCTLNRIAAYAAGINEVQAGFNASNVTVAVVPLTSGEGIIEGFSQAVADIVSFMGFNSFVTEQTDAGGLAEAVTKGAHIVFIADDDRFVAINLVTRKIADNSEATGRGYAAALDLMMKGIRDKKVLLLGAGPVGKSAALSLISFGAVLSVYDIDPVAGTRLSQEIYAKLDVDVEVEKDLESALLKSSILFDATPSKGYINRQYLGRETYIAAPGIPLGLSEDCLALDSIRLIHDPLQIGVATMMYEVLNPR